GDDLHPQLTEVLFHLGADGTATILQAFPSTDLTVMNLVRLGDGTLVGTRGHQAFQGKKHPGYVFAYKPSGAMRLLHRFDVATEGYVPRGDLAIGSDGALYGALGYGGTQGGGSLWRLDRHRAFSIVHAFGPEDPLGDNPVGVSTGADGLLYG